MRWVVLQQTVAPSVPQFDAVVATASRHCGTIWMEPNIINRPGKKKEKSGKQAQGVINIELREPSATNGSPHIS